MTLQDEQLFGAPPGDLTGVSVTVTFGATGNVCVSLFGHASMRKQAMWLRVSSDDKGNTSNIIGGLTPILVRASGMGVKSFRRWAWAAHNRLGRAGYEVQIQGCGQEPKH